MTEPLVAGSGASTTTSPADSTRPEPAGAGGAQARHRRASSSGWTRRWASWAQLKEDIRALVERYKQLTRRGRVGRRPRSSPAPARWCTPTTSGASTFIEKGWSLISLGDYAGAIQALDKALALAPGDIQAQSLLGWAQMLHEEYDDALATFSKVLMREPANALARINVGLHLSQEADLRRGHRASLARPSASTTTGRPRSTRTSIWGWSTSSGRCTRTPRRSSGRRWRSGPT